MAGLTKAQQLMIEDGCPPELIRTAEADQAARKAWIANPPKAGPQFIDPKIEADRKLREAHRKADAARQRERDHAKLNATRSKKSFPKIDYTGLRWCSRRAKWIRDDVQTQKEIEMPKLT